VKKVSRPFFEMKVVKVKGKKKEYCPRCGSEIIMEKPVGNWFNGENLDAIKFPCFCSYIVVLTGEKRYGELNKGWDDLVYKNNYTISNIEKQTTDMSVLYVDTSLKKLMINLKIKIEHGKVIIFEEEKQE